MSRFLLVSLGTLLLSAATLGGSVTLLTAPGLI